MGGRNPAAAGLVIKMFIVSKQKVRAEQMKMYGNYCFCFVRAFVFNICDLWPSELAF